MKVIDLSWPITNGTIVFPGDVSPTVKVATTVESDGYTTRLITTSSHTGTHMDAPAHMLADGKTLDQMANETFFGFAQVVDVTRCQGREIETADVAAAIKDVRKVDYLLFNTGWSERWGDPSYLEGYPVLSKAAACWLAGQDLKGVGFDAISVDDVDTTTNSNHKILLAAGLVIIENLHNLEQAAGEPFCFVALPLALENADGAPTRAMAVLN